MVTISDWPVPTLEGAAHMGGYHSERTLKLVEESRLLKVKEQRPRKGKKNHDGTYECQERSIRESEEQDDSFFKSRRKCQHPTSIGSRMVEKRREYFGQYHQRKLVSH